MKGKSAKIHNEWGELHESEQIILRRLIQSATKCCEYHFDISGSPHTAKHDVCTVD